VHVLLKPLVWLGLVIVIAMIASWGLQFGLIGVVVGAVVIGRGLIRGFSGST
jgi:hypothetical protein